MKNYLLTPGNLLKSTLTEIEISYNPKYKVSELPMVDSSNKAYTFLKDIFPSLNYREYFYILCLSRSNKP